MQNNVDLNQYDVNGLKSLILDFSDQRDVITQNINIVRQELAIRLKANEKKAEEVKETPAV